jgi:hypothetical protein
MASITFTVTSTTVNGSRAFTLTDAEVVRFATAWKAKVGTGATNSQALLDWAQTCMDQIKGVTLSYEQQQLAASATPLNPT